MIHPYGYVPDQRDQRDHLYDAPSETLLTLPTSVDLSSLCPDGGDQGQLGSCTAFAITKALKFNQMKERLPEYPYSELFLYYNERVMERTVASDAGAAIRDGIKSTAKTGVCAEDLWPYDIASFAVKPTDACYQAAFQHKSLSYQRVARSLSQMKGCLASGFPFVFGFTVYESFESDQVASTGIVPMPMPDENVLGGHAVLCCGYDDAQQRFLVQNSWGSSWGMAGYFTIPYAYLLNSGLASDYWTIRSVS